MHDPLDDPDEGDADLDGSPGAPLERVWRHPSEVGLDQRGRVDRRRGSVLAAGLVVAGLGLLAAGALLGVAGARDPVAGSASTSSPRDAIEPSVAAVSALDPTGSRTATAVVVDDDGHLVVRADTVAGATEVWVTCGDRAPQLAQVLGTDAQGHLAVLQVPDGGGRPVLVRPAGRDRDVLAVRSPGGERPVELGRARMTDEPGELRLESSTIRALAELAEDEGALFDRDGRFLGLVLTGDPARGQSDVGVLEVTALPARTVVDVARELAERSAAAGGWIGVTAEDAPAGGARVTDVVADGPAALAGVRVGDRIVAVGEDDVAGMDELVAAVRGARPGTEVTVVVVRDGTEVRAAVTTAARPPA